MNMARPYAHGAMAAAIAAIFLVDMHMPLGFAIPLLYLLVMLFAIYIRADSRVLLAIAVLCPGLAAAKLLAPPEDGVLWFGQANRIIFSLLMWAILGLELARRRFNRQLERLVEERTAALHRANRELQREVEERKQAERTVSQYAERLHGLANQLVDTQEVERRHLAAELHDRIGQNLSALNLNLHLNLSQLPADTAPAVQARITDSLALVERTTEIVRGVMEELHPALLDFYGLDAALRWYGEEFAGRTGIRVANEAPELFPRLRGKVETTLFRVVQEALTNVAKHAKAAQATVSLARTAAGIEMTVADDGVGMPAGEAGRRPIGSGWGLSIMAERARAIAADFRIQSQPGQGTRIVVKIPNGLWEIEDEHHRTDR